MIPFFNGPPPSKLGFVAKPEMPPHINILFRARPDLEYIEPKVKHSIPKYDFVHDGNMNLDKLFEDGPPPERQCRETPAQRKERIWKERTVDHYLKVKDEKKRYDPSKDPNATSDPSKTLFVSRLNFKTDEETLRREFEKFGPISSLRLVRNQKTGKSRGYAFVEFKHSRHCQRLYDENGMKIDGKRILVDFEAGRNDLDWLPKRLGGGKGNKRRDRDNEHKIRKVIKDYKSNLGKQSKEKSNTSQNESKRNDEKDKEEEKFKENYHKRQKITEDDENYKMDQKKTSSSKNQEVRNEMKEPISVQPPEERPDQDIEMKIENVSSYDIASKSIAVPVPDDTIQNSKGKYPKYRRTNNICRTLCRTIRGKNRSGKRNNKRTACREVKR